MKKSILLLMFLVGSLFSATFNVSTTPELRTALNTAATNGEDDTIILADGTYKTTDDGQGTTFIYLSNESNSLTLQGSSADNVILSGDSTHQIIEFNSISNDKIKLEKLSFIDANSSSAGGAIHTESFIEVIDCKFINNVAKSHGGGIYNPYGSLVINNSTFINNRSLRGSGGGVSSADSVVINNSTFTNNISHKEGGGLFAENIQIKNSLFKDNNSSYGGGFSSGSIGTNLITNSTFDNNSASVNGGGFASSGHSIVSESLFENNTAQGSGGGFHAFSTEVINSTFINNKTYTKGGGFYSFRSTEVKNSIFKNYYKDYMDMKGGCFYSGASATIVTNSLFANNFNCIDLGSYSSNEHVIVNNIFYNNTYDIKALDTVDIKYLSNNYIDVSKLQVSNIASNNIYEGVELGFIDSDSSNFNITSSSDFIDAGTTNINGLNFPDTDFEGNERIISTSIDIGPYEFTFSKPTINTFTYSGTAKELSQLTFNIEYTLESGRTISKIEYDYSNDATWTTTNTHTFNTAGTYTVNVKVTDSEGEFSVKSLDIIVAELAFADMTDEQKLVKAIDPQYYSEIMAIINGGSTLSYEDGKQYVQDNPSEFSLVEAGNILVTEEDIDAIPTGWSLLGSPSEITDLSIFANAKMVWTFDETMQQWSAYSPEIAVQNDIDNSTSINTLHTIPKKRGFWVKK
ncbi:MAG: PKD domain-containing protein [Campylobacterota bacterium]